MSWWNHIQMNEPCNFKNNDQVMANNIPGMRQAAPLLHAEVILVLSDPHALKLELARPDDQRPSRKHPTNQLWR